VVKGIFLIINKPKKNKIPFNLFNIGNGSSRKLNDYLGLIEKNLNIKAKIKKIPLQKADIKKTHSDISYLNSYTNYKPKVSIEIGVRKFVNWYLKYYKN